MYVLRIIPTKADLIYSFQRSIFWDMHYDCIREKLKRCGDLDHVVLVEVADIILFCQIDFKFFIFNLNVIYGNVR